MPDHPPFQVCEPLSCIRARTSSSCHAAAAAPELVPLGDVVHVVPRVERGVVGRVELADLELAHRVRATRPSSHTGPSDS